MWKAILNKIFKAREKVASEMQASSRRDRTDSGEEQGGPDQDDGDDDDDEEGYNDVEKPFLDHLDDLRKCLVGLVVTLVVGLILCFSFNAWLLEFFQAPLDWIDVPKMEMVDGKYEPVLDEDGEPVMTALRDGMGISSIEVVGTFMLAIRVSIIAAILLTFPVLLYFILDFILPGLRRTERKALYWALGIGMGLFLTGVAFCYAIVTPRVLDFFYNFGIERNIKVGWVIEDYVKFVTRLVLIFGIAFELPVVIMALVKIDVLNYRLMSTTRSYAAILIALVAAIITPTHDVMTLALLAVPMYLLYEMCIWMARMIERHDRRLHPEFYEDLDDDVEVADDWDHAGYDPWAELSERDEEDEVDDWHLDEPPPSDDDDGSGEESDDDMSLEDYSRRDLESGSDADEPGTDPDPEDDAGPGDEDSDRNDPR